MCVSLHLASHSVGGGLGYLRRGFFELVQHAAVYAVFVHYICLVCLGVVPLKSNKGCMNMSQEQKESANVQSQVEAPQSLSCIVRMLPENFLYVHGA